MQKVIFFNASGSFYGAEQGLINALNALVGTYEMTVVLPEKGSLYSELRTHYPYVHIHRFPQATILFSFSPFYYVWFLLLFVINFFYFLFYIKQHRFDIVVTNSSLLLIPALCAKLLRLKHVWFIREYFPARFVNSFLGKYIRHFSDTVVAQSQYIKEKMELFKNATVIYEPLRKEQFFFYPANEAKRTLHIHDTDLVISVIARLHPAKGQYEFIKAMKDTLTDNPDIILLLAGHLSCASVQNLLYVSKIRRFVKKHQLHTVRFLGYRRDIDTILSATDISVFPFQRDEPFGIAVTQSLMFRKKTFFPRRGGLREVFDIFKEGNEYSVSTIKDTIAHFRPPATDFDTPSSIPDALSFSRYQAKINSIFQSKNAE